MKLFKSEAELALMVCEWMDHEGWEVFKEVPWHGGRADIVGRCGKLTWVIECKLTLSLDVISQAENWTRYANFSSVATPQRKRSDWRKNAFMDRILEMCGIGLFGVGREVDISRKAPLHRKLSDPISQALVEEMKTYAAAGNADGNFWSPFKATCRELQRAVLETPGISMKAAIDKIDHHYSNSQSARGSLAHWIGAKKVQGIRSEIVKGKLCLYPVPII